MTPKTDTPRSRSWFRTALPRSARVIMLSCGTSPAWAASSISAVALAISWYDRCSIIFARLCQTSVAHDRSGFILPFKGMQTLANRIETLIQAMTLAEKLGQLTMTSSGYTVTGPIIAGDSTDAIRAGTIGNLLNMVGAAHCHEMQRLAVEGSRLG